MSDDKKVQVSIPLDLYTDAKVKLVKNGKTWQDFLLGKVKNYVKPTKMKKKGKKK